MTSINTSPSFSRLMLKLASLIVIAAVLAGCGAGSADSSCQASVAAGDPTGGYTDGGDGDGGGGGANSGDAGPGLGKFKNALVVVETESGVLPAAEIDETRGVVKISLCGYLKPVHVKVIGKPDGSSSYYDESKKGYGPFPAGAEMHAVVPGFTKNIGITILTDAAWYYLKEKYGEDGWKSAANVDEANLAIRDFFNSYLPEQLRIADITRLPELLSEDTTKVEATNNGKYGIVTSGLARAAGLLLRPGEPQDFDAGIIMARQLGRDLCDGKLDYTACDGKPFFSASEKPAYLPAQFAEFLNAGIGDIAARCGSAATEASSLRIVAAKVETSFPYGAVESALEFSKPLYSKRTPIWLLRNDGKVFFWSHRDATPELHEKLQGESFRQLFPQGPLLGATYTGKVFSRAPLEPIDSARVRSEWLAKSPDVLEQPEYFGVSTVATMETIMSDDNPTFHWWSTFQLIARQRDGEAYIDPRDNWSFSGHLSQIGVSNVSSVAVTNGWGLDQEAYFAVTTDGKVFAKGYGYGGQLGLPDMKDPWRVDEPTALTFPQSNVFIVSVAGRQLGAYALDRDGGVWSWGDDTSDIQFTRSHTPVKLPEFDAYAPIRQIECAHMRQCAAISKNGEMLVWGTFYEKSVDEVPVDSSMEAYKKSYGIFPVGLDGHRIIYIGSNGWTVYGVRDDGKLVVFPSTPESPLVLDPPVQANLSGSCVK